MGTTVISGGQILLGRDLVPGRVVVDEERIAAVEPGEGPWETGGARAIDASGYIVAPGYLDVHVHGGAGHDTMDASREALEGMGRFFAAHGVTAFLPTTVTGEQAETMAALRAVAAYQEGDPPAARALGVHLEGPYISASYMGAQNPAFVRQPDWEDYRRLFSLGNVRLLSLAPEVPGAQALVAYALSQGARVAVGHSAATYDQVQEAVGWGLTGAAHTYNAMQGMHHREPGTTGAVLTLDDIYAQVIVDLVHVHPAMVDLLVRAKGLERTVLITDAMRAAGMADGRYELGGQTVIVQDGEARLPAGNLAGSTLTMDRAVRNVMRAACLSAGEALYLATHTPAASIGVEGRKGELAPGHDADIILLDKALNVKLTMVMGRVVYP